MTSIFHILRTVILALFAKRTALLAENLVLRQQVIVLRRGVAQPRIRPFDRWLIATLAGRFRELVQTVVLVKPETVIGWHRSGWRLLWRWRSRFRRPPGRPPIDADRRALIHRMWRDNPTWGEDRIAGELAKLGYGADSRTVAKYRPAGLARGRGQRWTTFIRNHLQETWACDFLVVVTARFRILYVFVVLSLGRRRIVHLGVTAHPTSAWTAQRMVEAVADAELPPRFLVHDRDAIYGTDFTRRVRGLGEDK